MKSEHPSHETLFSTRVIHPSMDCPRCSYALESLTCKCGGELGARRQSRLLEDVMDVILRRRDRDAEGLCDVAVAMPGGNEPRDLLLAL